MHPIRREKPLARLTSVQDYVEIMEDGSNKPSTEIVIRLCRIEDISRILDIRQKTFKHFAPAAYSPKEVETLLADVNELELIRMVEQESLFVAKKGQQIAGCGGWLDDSVRHMYVSPEITKQGIGSKLLKVLEEDFQKRTHQSVIKAGVILYARPFYEKNGYEFLSLDTDWDGSQFNRMQKRLTFQSG